MFVLSHLRQLWAAPTSDAQLWHPKLMDVNVSGRSHLLQLWASPTFDAQLWHAKLMDVTVFGRSHLLQLWAAPPPTPSSGTQNYWTVLCLDEVTSDSPTSDA